MQIASSGNKIEEKYFKMLSAEIFTQHVLKH